MALMPDTAALERFSREISSNGIQPNDSTFNMSFCHVAINCGCHDSSGHSWGYDSLLAYSLGGRGCQGCHDNYQRWYHESVTYLDINKT